MKRRDFLRWSVCSILGALLGQGEILPAEAAYYEPMIYKRFLQFTEYEVRPATEMLVIHHTGFPNEDKDSTVQAIHKFHQETFKWAGVGYHYLIRKNGMIEQGRRPDMVGAHAYGHNKNSLGICLAGNFDIGKPTAAQMDAVKELCRWLCQKYKLDPLRKGTIVGHRDLNDTACPGKRLYRRLEEIRWYCAEHSH